MAKIDSYRIGFNPTTNLGLIEFHEVGRPNAATIGNLPADEFSAIAAVLATGEAYAEGQWIHSGIESLNLKSTPFTAPSTGE
ncbi:MAG TPA: hypothetical protein VK151_08625 [Fluviicola sp.]|nr:hypothetical protein [Fluviicola sp.]